MSTRITPPLTRPFKVSREPNQNQELLLTAKLEQNPTDWDTRQQLAHLLYDQGNYGMAAVIIWEADQIPSTDMDIAFAARILAKDQPRKAIRLLNTVLQHNKGKAVQNMGMANALLHHGMVLQAARFYGAALEADPDLVNPDLEHFILWTDEEQSLWGDFKNRRPKLGELPWMARDPMEALKLTSRVALHTTPIAVPKLKPVLAEDLNNSLYQQPAEKGAKITPPPAVTIPADRIDPKHRRFDSSMGADVDSTPEKSSAPANETAAKSANESQKPSVAPTPALPVKPATETSAKIAVAQPAPTVRITKGVQAPKPTLSADGKIRRPSSNAPAGTIGVTPPADAIGSPLIRTPGGDRNAPVDMDAIEAAAKAEITQKVKISQLAKAATDEIRIPPRPTTPGVSPIKIHQAPQTSKEPLPALDTRAQTHPDDKPQMAPEQQAAALEEMKKTRAVARAAAKEKRLAAATAGVPLPATEGRKGEWYYIHEDQAVGPVLAQELKEKLNDPSMRPPLKMIWSIGMERWMPVYECPELWQELNEAGV